ncbi:MAG: hypothetical protein M1840_009092 [Geoglossum simile]|nr:MAG: hypothetical protein M1840_009092 [Geoglossum simile]
MAAAAYTKDLLYQIPPNKVETENRISDLLSSDSEEFQIWLQTSKQTLYYPGIPGAGKTILTSIVVDDLIRRPQNNPNIGIAYLYCNFRQQEEQKAEDLLASLLKQLSQGQSSLPDSSSPVCGYHIRVFIIIDALDKCQVTNGCRSRFLSEIFNLQVKCGASIFATSRFVPEITEKFNGSILLEIRASNEDVRKYLKGHMSQLPSFVSRNVDLQEEIMTEIVQAIDRMFLLTQLYLDSLIGRSWKAIRMALRCLWKEPILLSNDKAKALDSAYKQAMERIEGQMGDQTTLAKQVLVWITCAKRALTASELRHALGVEIGTSIFDEENLPELEDTVSICAGLVTVDEESDIIRLVHYTTQEYFERTWTCWFPNAQTDITNVCITYLSFNVFEMGFCQSDGEFEARLRTNVLYDYAAQNWGHHACTASIGEGSIEEDLILNFLKSRAKVSATGQAMMASKSYPGYSQRVPRQMTGIHIAAYFGLVGMMMGLLKNGCNPDLRDSYGHTPLSWAAKRGHEAVVKLLLERGAELESKDSGDSYSLTPLSWAAVIRHEAVVKLLLERGAELESKDSHGRTPLSWAAEEGHEAVVKLLLERGAELGFKDSYVKLLLASEKVDVDSKDSSGRTPLSWAAESGHEAVVKLLLATERVDVDSKSYNGQTPLSWVAEMHDAVAILLLATEKVDVDSKYGRTPLSWAAESGHDAVVKLLLATERVALDSKSYNGRTPLSWAAEKGHEAVVELLLATEMVKLLQSHCLTPFPPDMSPGSRARASFPGRRPTAPELCHSIQDQQA